MPQVLSKVNTVGVSQIVRLIQFFALFNPSEDVQNRAGFRVIICNDGLERVKTFSFSSLTVVDDGCVIVDFAKVAGL